MSNICFALLPLVGASAPPLRKPLCPQHAGDEFRFLEYETSHTFQCRSAVWTEKVSEEVTFLSFQCFRFWIDLV